MNILIVSNFYPPHVIGGAEIVAARQAKALHERGHHVSVLAGCYSGEGREPASLTFDVMDDIPVYRLALTSLAVDDNFYSRAFAKRMRAVLETARPEVVHFHNVMGLGANLIHVAREFGARVVVTLHDHWGFCYKNTLLLADESVCDNFEDCGGCLDRISQTDGRRIPLRLRRDYVALSVSAADVAIAPSAYMTNAYARSERFSCPFMVISNGIDLTAIPPQPRVAPDVVHFSSFSYLGRHKGIHLLLEAVQRLAERPELAGKWHLSFAGHGDLAVPLQDAIATGKYDGAVSYLGRLDRSAVLEALAQADVFINASIWPENEPVTLLEATASGAALLASRIGGNVGLVEDEKSGLLFTPDSADALYEAMLRYITEPELVAKFSARNLQRRDQFCEHETISRLLDVYEGAARVPSNDDNIVICAGAPDHEALDTFLQKVNLLEDMKHPVHFLWHEWADPALWQRAKVFWLWGEPNDEEHLLITRAMRMGVPILIASDNAFSALEQECDGVVSYASMLEAMGLISVMTAPEEPAYQPDHGTAQVLDTVFDQRHYLYRLAAIP